MRLAAFAVLLAACDPVWGAHTTLRDPSNQPIENATVSVACPDGTRYGNVSVKSDRNGVADVGGIGTMFPVGCDLYIAKPGFRTQRIQYTELCPGGERHCERVFTFELVLQPE